MISRDEVRSRGDGVNAGAGGSVESAATIELRRLLTAAMFFTRLPCPSWVDHNPRHLVPGMVYFPAIGGLVGLWVWRPLAAAGAVMMGVWLTGCFHEDGLADTVDAFGGGWGKDQILRIMKDSRVGTYAVVVTSLFMIAKVHAIAALPDELLLPGILAGHMTARWSILPICFFTPYVAETEEENDKVVYNSFAACLNNGLLSAKRVLIASAYTFAIVSSVGVVKGMVLILGQAVLCVGASTYALGVLDGVIGDYLGATIMVSELTTYLLLIADLSRFADGGWWPVLRLLLVGVPMYFSMAGAGELPKDRAAKKRKQKGC